MRAGLYARVSTDEQTLEQQLQELRHVAKSREYESIEYIDHGRSGALPENMRPGLKQMMEDAKRHRINIVMCWDVSRLGRSMPIVVELVERLRGFKVQFATLRDNIDTMTPQGEFQFHVFAALAQLQRKMISQNTKAKLALLRDQGVILGRPRVEVQRKRKAVDPREVVKFYSISQPKPTLRQMETRFLISRMTVSRILKAAAENLKLAVT